MCELTGFTSLDLARMNESSLYEVYRLFGRATRSLHEEPDISWTAIQGAVWPNYIFNARIEKEQLKSRVAALSEEVRLGKVPPFWIIGPTTAYPNELRDHLELAGFRKQTELVAMVADLSHMNRVPVPSGLDIHRVRNRVELEWWIRMTTPAPIDLLELLVKEYLIKPYLGWMDGMPVASSLSIASSGVVGLFMVGTLPKFRKRGIGSSMTIVPALEARSQDLTVACLQATEMGEGVYRKLGFKPCFTFDLYAWVPNWTGIQPIARAQRPQSSS